MLEVIKEQIDSIEGSFRELSTMVNDAALVENLAPKRIWGLCEERVGDLKELLGGLRENLLILDPGRSVTITRSAQAAMDTFDTLKRVLTEETDETEDPKIITDRFTERSVPIYTYLNLAKGIVERPNPLIKEILLLRVKSIKSEIPDIFRRRFKKLSEDSS
ncbi:MAG: hypothetical protein ACE5OY_06935 [Candidatus Bathyarchaeia archaeon]